MLEDKERNAIIAKHLAEGTSLSDIQKVLEREHDYKITYMELRLISSELEVDWEKFEPAKPEADKVVEGEETIDPDPDDVSVSSGTSVTVSKLTRPGALFHGDATFTSGAKAEWTVDQTGRLALAPKPGSAKPTEEDIQDFQVELQRVIESQMGAGGMGY